MAFQQTKLPPARDDYAFRIRQKLDFIADITDGETKLRRLIGAEGFFQFLEGTDYYEIKKIILNTPTNAWAKANALFRLQSQLARESSVFGEEDIHAVLDKEEDESESLEIQSSD